MINILSVNLRPYFVLFFPLASVSVYSQEPTQNLDPRFYFFMNGQTIGDRGFQVGDPDNWSTALTNLSGKSASGKVEAQPEDYQGKSDALHVTWSKQNVQGQLALYGPTVDLNDVKDLAALTMDLKVSRRPNGKVTIGMDCGWPCRAEVRVDKQLKKEKTGEWFVFPIPLNCFKSDNFDLTKINGPLMIGTSGRLELSIANVRLVRLPEGEKGCAEEAEQ